MAPLTYGIAGFGLAVYVNLVRKLPAFRRPWEHVAFFGVGCFVGSKVEVARAYMKGELAYLEGKREEQKVARAAKVAAWQAKKKAASAQEKPQAA